MKIAMFTNTYLPHVGGVARSVSEFAATYRELGHDCLVIAPEFEDESGPETNVHRVPAITNFNDSGFSYRIPFAGDIANKLDAFNPDIIHSHHPFLLGDTALRSAYARNIPIIFTHHTLYEEYTNYLPFNSDFTKSAAIELATAYANACSMVFAPSQSVAELIQERGVKVPIAVRPTGIRVSEFASGDGKEFRSGWGIPREAFVVGHVGRIAKEKNLRYLAEACVAFLKKQEDAYVVIVGSGEQDDEIALIAKDSGLDKRIVFTGSLQGKQLWDAYASFDVFAFASQSETQGLVLAEAMAGGATVIALDGPGVRDVLRHKKNGLLLEGESSTESFSKALQSMYDNPNHLEQYRKAAVRTAREMSTQNAAHMAQSSYRNCISKHNNWVFGTGLEEIDKVLTAIEGEIQILKTKITAVASAIV